MCSKITFFETFLVLFVCAIQNLSDFCSSSKISSSRGIKWHLNKNWTRMCSSYLVIKHYFSKSSLRYLHLCICLNYFVRIKKIGCSVAVCFNTHGTFGLPLFSFCLFVAKIYLCISQVGEGRKMLHSSKDEKSHCLGPDVHKIFL